MLFLRSPMIGVYNLITNGNPLPLLSELSRPLQDKEISPSQIQSYLTTQHVLPKM